MHNWILVEQTAVTANLWSSLVQQYQPVCNQIEFDNAQ